MHRKDGDFPVAWARTYGKGRVFGSVLGHADETWDDPVVQQMYFGAIKWALGLVPGDARPRPKPADSARADLEGKDVIRPIRWRSPAGVAACAAVALAVSAPAAQTPTLHRQARRIMGTFCEVQVYDADAARASAAITMALDEMQRVDRLLSNYDPGSELSVMNRDAARGPSHVSEELFAFVRQCRDYVGWTDGALTRPWDRWCGPGGSRRPIRRSRRPRRSPRPRRGRASAKCGSTRRAGPCASPCPAWRSIPAASARATPSIARPRC